MQNYKTPKAADVPSGILIAGSGTGINILNNTVKNIQTTAGKNWQRLRHRRVRHEQHAAQRECQRQHGDGLPDR